MLRRAYGPLLLMLTACNGGDNDWTLVYSGSASGAEEGVHAVFLKDPGVIEDGVHRLTADLYTDPATGQGPFPDPVVSLSVLDYDSDPTLEDLRIWGLTDGPCTPTSDEVTMVDFSDVLVADIVASVDCSELDPPQLEVTIHLDAP